MAYGELKMPATFIQRCIAEEPYEEDGGAIDLNVLHQLLHLFFCGMVDAAYIHTLLALTVDQATEFDAYLASSQHLFIDNTRWANCFYAALLAGGQHYPGFETSVETTAMLASMGSGG